MIGFAAEGEGRSPITVLLATELGLLRHALVGVLSLQDDIAVVGAVADNSAVPRLAHRMRPDVVVIDVDQLTASEPSMVRRLRAQLPQTSIVALVTARPTRLLHNLLEAGVMGAVSKNAPASRLLDAVRGAARGQMVVDASLAIAAIGAPPTPLTPREREVLQAVANGISGREISTRLNLTPGTVRNYLSKAMAKTGARTRIDAVRIAQESGWL